VIGTEEEGGDKELSNLDTRCGCSTGGSWNHRRRSAADSRKCAEELSGERMMVGLSPCLLHEIGRSNTGGGRDTEGT